MGRWDKKLLVDFWADTKVHFQKRNQGLYESMAHILGLVSFSKHEITAQNPPVEPAHLSTLVSWCLYQGQDATLRNKSLKQAAGFANAKALPPQSESEPSF